MNSDARLGFVARPSAVVGGLVTPWLEPGPETSGSDIVRFQRERIQDRAPDADVYTVYVPDQPGPYNVPGRYNVVVGVLYPTPDAVPVGDVFAYVPAGAFAVFTPKLTLPDPVEDVWAQMDDAIRDGVIIRARGIEFEALSPSGHLELHVAVVLN